MNTILLPIELLQQQLDELLIARDKSMNALKQGRIDPVLADKHILNLSPKIECYRFAINMLKRYTDEF